MKSQQHKQPRLTLVVPFKSILFTSIICSVIILFTIVILLFYVQNKGIAQNTAQHYVVTTSAEVIRATEAYISNAERKLMSLYLLFANNVTNVNDTDNLLNILNIFISTDTRIDTLYLANEKGHLYMSKRMPGGSISNRIVYRTNNKIISQWFHEDKELNHQFPEYEETNLEEGYDPRKRSWYRIAQLESIIWSPPYIFHSNQQPGITATRRISNEYLNGVLAVDISFAYLNKFVKELQFNISGETLITNENNDVIAYSNDSKKNNTTIEIQNAASLKNMHPALKYKLQSFNKGEIDLVKSKNIIQILTKLFIQDRDINIFDSVKIKNQAFAKIFSYDEHSYVYSNIKFPLFNGIKWNMHFLTDELSVVGNVYNTIKIGIGVLVVIFIIIMLIFARISSIITYPIGQLAKLMENMRNLNLEHQYENQKRLKIAELASMGQIYNNAQKSLVSFKKFVPKAIIQRAIIQNTEITPQMEMLDNITIIFSDIVGFTSITEAHSPQNLSEALNIYFTELSTIIYRYNGIIDKFIGDSIMGLFGIFNKNENHAENACKSALIMQLAHEKINKIISEKNSITFQTRIGINSEQALVGTIGSDTKLNFTVLGDSVNLASRLEGLNKKYNSKIIISEYTKNQISDRFITKYLDSVQVKGKTQYTKVYLLLGYK